MKAQKSDPKLLKLHTQLVGLMDSLSSSNQMGFYFLTGTLIKAM
jgi:hypothetical protein